MKSSDKHHGEQHHRPEEQPRKREEPKRALGSGSREKLEQQWQRGDRGKQSEYQHQRQPPLSVKKSKNVVGLDGVAPNVTAKGARSVVAARQCGFGMEHHPPSVGSLLFGWVGYWMFVAGLIHISRLERSGPRASECTDD